MSITNANNARAMIKIADGAMKETSDSLDSIKTKLINIINLIHHMKHINNH